MLAAAAAFLAERQAQGGNAWRLAELADGPGRLWPPGWGCPTCSPRSPAVGPDRDRAAPAHPARPRPGPIRQRDGASALVIGIPLGSLSADQAGALAQPAADPDPVAQHRAARSGCRRPQPSCLPPAPGWE